MYYYLSIVFFCLQVADRLFSSFGQDILDALYWTATEPKERKRDNIGVIPHFIMAVFYVCILDLAAINVERRFKDMYFLTLDFCQESVQELGRSSMLPRH